jgi:putative endonuclease
MATKVCLYWECDVEIKRNHFACRDHWEANHEGEVDECPSCDNLKRSDYDLCRPCELEARTILKEDRSTYAPDPSPAWAVGDEGIDEFYAYILKLDDGGFYAGHTRDLRVRMTQHRDGTGAKATKGKDPQLVWFTESPDRKTAMEWESELKALIKRNPTQVRTMCLHFLDLVKETGNL